jgi:glycerol-3-phosphate dehydrogenase (NAD(P)+)
MNIVVIGSGSWGTALAQVLCDNQHQVTLLGKNIQELNEINEHHTNSRYFPKVELHPGIQASSDFSLCNRADFIVLAVPSIAIEDVIATLNSVLEKPKVIINVAKGFHPSTHERLSVFIKHHLNDAKLLDVVSLIGPSHAEEVVLRLPTTLNAVCANEAAAQSVQELFSNAYFRVYRNTDEIGSEIAVAVKNVIALGSGMLSGLGFGDNARAALITRGLAEITRFGLASGAKPDTFLGLAGVGDLIVTCTSPHSRNFQAGLRIGKENSAAGFMRENVKTVEGVFAAKIVHEEALRLGIEMPITHEIYNILYEGTQPSDALKRLMSRSLKVESEGFY